jgi:hypothetical protein
MTNPVQDEDKDPMDEMNEDEEADGPSDDIISPKVLAKKGLHIEGEDEPVDPDTVVEPPHPDLAFLGDDDLDTPIKIEEDEDEIDVDEEFGDKDEQW